MIINWAELMHKDTLTELRGMIKPPSEENLTNGVDGYASEEETESAVEGTRYSHRAAADSWYSYLQEHTTVQISKGLGRVMPMASLTTRP